MKLRNKNTGEIARRIDISANGEIIWVFDELHPIKYERLKDLIEDWEDYEPKEPLIKDEKIRKIIRLWAEVNNSNKLFIGSDWVAIDEEDYTIEFADDNVFDFPAGHYTIAELCGKEEE